MRLWRAGRKGLGLEPKDCAHCGQTFQPTHVTGLYCSARCKDGAYYYRHRGMRAGYLRAYYRAHREAWHDRDECPGCGEPKDVRAKLCRMCYDAQRTCRAGWCETYPTPHHHCLCGWPIAPEKTACHICIAEQVRLERKRLISEEDLAA